MATSFPFLRLPPELQIKVCEFYFAKSFTIHVFPRPRSFSFVGDINTIVQDELTVRSKCQSNPLPHATPLLQASPDLYEQARTALLQAFNGQVYCMMFQQSLPYTINFFLEKLLTYPLRKERVRHITLCVDHAFLGGPRLSTVFGRDWKEFVEVVGHSRLLNLELISIKLDNCVLTGLIRDEHDVELFLQGGRDDALVTCIQRYLPKMEVSDSGKIERADGLHVPVAVSMHCHLSTFPNHRMTDDELFAEAKVINPQTITIMRREVFAFDES